MNQNHLGPAQGPPTAIGLSIDRLSVEGLGEPDARRLAGALELRLDALIQERGLPKLLSTQGAVELDTLEVPGLQLDLRRGPERAGFQLAEALWTRLQRPLQAHDRREPER